MSFWCPFFTTSLVIYHSYRSLIKKIDHIRPICEIVLILVLRIILNILHCRHFTAIAMTIMLTCIILCTEEPINRKDVEFRTFTELRFVRDFIIPCSASWGATFSSLMEPTHGTLIGWLAPGPASTYAVLGMCQNTISGMLENKKQESFNIHFLTKETNIR